MLGFLSDNYYLSQCGKDSVFLIKYQKMEGTNKASTSATSRQQ